MRASDGRPPLPAARLQVCLKVGASKPHNRNSFSIKPVLVCTSKGSSHLVWLQEPKQVTKEVKRLLAQWQAELFPKPYLVSFDAVVEYFLSEYKAGRVGLGQSSSGTTASTAWRGRRSTSTTRTTRRSSRSTGSPASSSATGDRRKCWSARTRMRTRSCRRAEAASATTTTRWRWRRARVLTTTARTRCALPAPFPRLPAPFPRLPAPFPRRSRAVPSSRPRLCAAPAQRPAPNPHSCAPFVCAAAAAQGRARVEQHPRV